jgi:hypothetical protein
MSLRTSLHNVTILKNSPITTNILRAPDLTRFSSCSSVSIVSDYGLDDLTFGVRSPADADYFSSNLCVRTSSGVHPASCTMGTGGSFPRDKARPGRDADHSPHLVPRSRMSRSYTSSPPSATMACSGTALLC